MGRAYRRSRESLLWKDTMPKQKRTDQEWKAFIAEIKQKLEDFTRPGIDGTLTQGQTKWVRILSNEFGQRGCLTDAQKEALDNIHEQVFGI